MYGERDGEKICVNTKKLQSVVSHDDRKICWDEKMLLDGRVEFLLSREASWKRSVRVSRWWKIIDTTMWLSRWWICFTSGRIETNQEEAVIIDTSLTSIRFRWVETTNWSPLPRKDMGHHGSRIVQIRNHDVFVYIYWWTKCDSSMNELWNLQHVSCTRAEWFTLS